MSNLSCPAATTVNALARAWSAKHPELQARIERAVALVANVEAVDHDIFVVEGERDFYEVRIDPKGHRSTCSCPDSTARKAHCKHRLACALFLKGQAA